MTAMPRPILITVIALLAVAAAFGLVSGFTTAGGQHGFDREDAAATGTIPAVVADAKPLDTSAPPEDVAALTPEEEAAKKAEEDKKAADEKKAAEMAALPKTPVPYTPPVVAPPISVQPAPGTLEGPPPATPEQNGPNLY